MTPPIYRELPERALDDDLETATDTVRKLKFNVEKALRILGMGTAHQPRRKEGTMRDTLERFKALEFEI